MKERRRKTKTFCSSSPGRLQDVKEPGSTAKSGRVLTHSSKTLLSFICRRMEQKVMKMKMSGISQTAFGTSSSHEPWNIHTRTLISSLLDLD